MYRLAFAGLLVIPALLGAYLKWVRPRQLRWGATDAEVARPMPGDDIVRRPAFNATRALTINADPGEVWPWIAQMGLGRGGWYSYDWIDNLGRPSARVILPQYQLPEPGDLIPFSPDGKRGLWVKSFERNRSMLWWDKEGAATWCWALYPGDSGVRLVTRVRLRYNWRSPRILFHLALEFGDIFMMRRCLLGIKERAEAAARERRASVELIETLIAGAFHSA